jgi:hypothetical protein
MVLRRNEVVLVLVLICLFFDIYDVNGQTPSTQLSQQCDPYSLWMLSSIVEKVPISSEKQLKLFALFNNEKAKLCDSATRNKIRDYHFNLLGEISEILSDEEIEKLLADRPISKLFELLILKNKLNLNASQIDTIESCYFLAMDSIKYNRFFNVGKFDRTTLKSILTFNQILLYLRPKVAHRVDLKTYDDWNVMLVSGIAAVSDSIRIWDMLENYNYNREVIIEIYQDNRPERNAMLRDLDRDKDPLLKRLDVAIKEEERRKINQSKGIESVKKFQGNYNY